MLIIWNISHSLLRIRLSLPLYISFDKHHHDNHKHQLRGFKAKQQRTYQNQKGCRNRTETCRRLTMIRDIRVAVDIKNSVDNVYTMLKECNMDQSEATQRLLYIGMIFFCSCYVCMFFSFWLSVCDYFVRICEVFMFLSLLYTCTQNPN